VNKAVDIGIWRKIVNEKINALFKDLESERKARKELMLALNNLNESIKSLWDTVITNHERISKLEKRIAKLEGSNRAVKRWWWIW